MEVCCKFVDSPLECDNSVCQARYDEVYLHLKGAPLTSDAARSLCPVVLRACCFLRAKKYGDSVERKRTNSLCAARAQASPDGQVWLDRKMGGALFDEKRENDRLPDPYPKEPTRPAIRRRAVEDPPLLPVAYTARANQSSDDRYFVGVAHMVELYAADPEADGRDRRARGNPFDCKCEECGELLEYFHPDGGLCPACRERAQANDG